MTETTDTDQNNVHSDRQIKTEDGKTFERYGDNEFWVEVSND